jgi:hypothetical protein
MYIKEKTLGENYKAACEVWRERNPKTWTKCRCKITVNNRQKCHTK